MKVFLVEILNTWDNPFFQFEKIFSSKDKALEYLRLKADCDEEYLLTSISVDTNKKEFEESYTKYDSGELVLEDSLTY